MFAKSGLLSIVCAQLGPRKLSVIWSREVAAKQGFLSTILNGNAVGTKMSVRHRQGGCSSKVAVKRGSTVQTKKHCIKSLLLDKRSCFSQSKTSTVQLTIEHMFVF